MVVSYLNQVHVPEMFIMGWPYVVDRMLNESKDELPWYLE